MSYTEPATPAQLDQIAASAKLLSIAWGSRTPDLTSFLSTAAAEGARIAREDVPALLAENARLLAALADARCAVSHLAPAARIADNAQRRNAQLAAENTRLLTEMADAKAMLAKTIDNFQAALGLDEDEPLTIWRAHTDRFTLGFYTSSEEARAHCEDEYHQGAPAKLTWYPETPDDDSALRMYAEGLEDGASELETEYAVAPVPVHLAFDPAGES